MKARGYLELLIEENPTDEHAAALRELDGLIADMMILAKQKLMGEDISNWEDMLQFWYERAAQAGYGEK